MNNYDNISVIVPCWGQSKQISWIISPLRHTFSLTSCEYIRRFMARQWCETKPKSNEITKRLYLFVIMKRDYFSSSSGKRKIVTLKLSSYLVCIAPESKVLSYTGKYESDKTCILAYFTVQKVQNEGFLH